MKKCTKCGQEKELSCFGPTKQQLKNGVKSWCRDCERAYKAEWAKKDPVRQANYQAKSRGNNREKIRAWNRDYAERTRKAHPEKVAIWQQRAFFKRRYGVSLEWRDAKIAEQGNLCKICGLPPGNGENGLAVDHCHKTGKVRDLLCVRCNTALHKMEADLDWFRKAEAYLIRHG
jgi:hypothetical protein